MESKPKHEDNIPGQSFPIVGIGASAGGLYSLERFLSELHEEFGFAIVFVQHLSPTHENLLPELLESRRPDLDVLEVSEGQQILPGQLYLCPPAKEVKIENGILHIAPRANDHLHLPIDEFLISLAEDVSERAVGVIFSGAGTDGVRGIRAVRNAGGTVFVQEPTTAEFPAMPLAAINAGAVDGIFSPEEIAREILRFQASDMAAKVPEHLMGPAGFESIYRLIYDKTGYRFNHYKKSVVARRIRRRMYLHGISSADEYLQLLSNRESEPALLASDLMIGVTSFFRDQLAWKDLHIEVTRKLAAQAEDVSIRVWTPACATGEEAYSIAMLLHHELDLAGRRREIQIFATDVNDRSLAQAREGKYPATTVASLPPEYLHKFFVYSEDGLSVTINKEIRQYVVFAKHDLLTDPPFSRLDLIICRNLLIYLEPDAQEKCIALFHYALRDKSYLFLGNAESPGRKSAFFSSIGHKKCRLYQKVDLKPSAKLSLTSTPFVAERLATVPSRPTWTAESQPQVSQFVQEALLEEFAPAAIAIDQYYNIVYHNGPTHSYLRQPRGTPTQNLLELIPENLRNRVRGALYRTGKEMRPVSIRTGVAGDDEKKRQVTIRVSRLREGVFLIIFREKGSLPEGTGPILLENAAMEETALRQLENELTVTRDDLQSHIEQLKSLNEELHSSNEELQAANEELETSREELQSLNEELITVNAQLQTKVEEQEETNNDLNNFLASTNIPTIFLDQKFRVKRFTPAMLKLIKLLPGDMGRPIVDMSQENLGPDLITDAQSVLDNLTPVKKELELNNSWYVRMVLPYRTSDNRIEGVVIAYADVTELKLAEERLRKAHDDLERRVKERTKELREANETLEMEITERQHAEEAVRNERQRLYDVLETLPAYVVLLSPDYRLAFANRVFRERFGESDGRRCFEFLFNRTEPCEVCETYTVLKTKAPHHWEWTGPDGRDYDIFDYPFTDTDGSALILEMGIDVTERNKAEKALREINETLEQRVAERTEALNESRRRLSVVVDSIADGFFAMDRDWRITHINDWALAHLGRTRAETVGHLLFEVFPEARGTVFEIEYHRAMESGEPVRFEAASVVSDKIMEVHAYPGPENLTVLFRDITEQHHMTQALREAHDRAEWLARFPDENPNPIIRASTEGLALYCNPAARDLPAWACKVGDRVPDLFVPLVEQAMTEERERSQEVELGGKFYSLDIRPIPGEGYINIYGRDITDRKRAENRIISLTRLYAVLSRVNEAIVRIHSEEQLYAQVCRIVAEEGNFPLVWIGKLKREQVVSVASCGQATSYLKETKVELTGKLGRGPTGTCIRENRPVINDDFATNAATSAWREPALRYGFHASAAFPLRRRDKAIGAFTLYAYEPNAFDTEQVDLLESLSADISYALDTLDQEQLRIATEKALLQAKEEWERTFDSVPDMIAILDNEHKVVRINEAMAQRLGIRPEECIGLACYEAVHGTSTPPGFCPHSRTLADCRQHIEEVHEDRLGGDFVVSTTPLYDDQGSMTGSVHVARDITQRKRVETELHIISDTASRLLMSPNPQKVVESLCRRIMEHLGCHVFFNFLVNEEKNCLWLNAYAGIPEETAREIRFLDFGVAVCGCAARDACRIVAENIPTTHDVRTDLVRSFGITAYACHPLLAQGRVIGTLSFGTRSRLTFTEDELSLMKTVADQVATAMERLGLLRAAEERAEELERRVEERTADLMQKEQVLRAASAYTRSLLEASLDPLITIDRDGRIADVNSATETVTGYPRDDLVGTDFADCFTDRQKAMAGYQLAFEKGIVRDYELEIRHRDGHVVPVLYNASVYRDGTGQVAGVFAAARDVTEQRLLEDQLRQAHKMEAIGTLAGGIAHDFNNSLAAIIGFTEMSVEDLTDRSEVQKNLKRVLKSATRARDLVKQILTFSRKSEQKRNPISLSGVVKDTTQFLSASIPSTIEVNVNITATSDVIVASPVEIEQVLMNLCTNAAHAMQEKGGVLDVSVTDINFGTDSSAPDAGPLTGAYLQLMVRDTGIGMAPDVMKRVFEPFFTTKGVGQGTGMGLAVVYGIVKDLQGTITVESTPGEGSVFRVLLPKVDTDRKADVTNPGKAVSGSERILFVDDEELLMEWGQTTLSRLGYKVTAVSNSTEALKVFSADPSLFDLVITDQTMPVMTGIQLARRVLAIRGNIPIILCTGHSETASPEITKKAGIRQFLMKPVNRTELAEAVRRVLDN